MEEPVEVPERREFDIEFGCKGAGKDMVTSLGLFGDEAENAELEDEEDDEEETVEVESRAGAGWDIITELDA